MRCIAALTVVVAACGGDDAQVAADANAPGVDAPLADSPLGGPVQVADLVIDAPGSTGGGFGDPDRAVNGIRGGGRLNGSLDVYSLRFPPALNTSITVAWSGAKLANGPGADLVIFENPFDTDVGPFMDLIVVEVSRDGVTWRPLAHDYVTPDETTYVRDRAAWVGFAGRTPVLFHAEDNVVDPFDATQAGGDALDLDTIVGDDAEAVEMRATGVTQVKLIAAPALINADTDAPFVADDHSNGPDIDGVIGRYVVAP